MSARQRQWLVLAGLCLLAALAFVLFGELIPQRRLVDLGPGPEARANPWLAAERFLRQRGLAVSRTDSLTAILDDTPAAGHSLLLLGSRQQLSAAQSQRLLDWSANGGHLIVIAEANWSDQRQRSNDLLLDLLQVHRLPTSSLKDEDAPTPQVEDPWPQLTRLYLENEDAPAYFAFDTRYHLEDAGNRAQAWAGSAGATHLLQLAWGDGLVTVLSDANLWRNERIGEHDHAWLLWYLTQDSEVIFLQRIEADHLVTLLLRHFSAALLALGLLIVLLLWRFGLRHGPLQTDPLPARRQLGEHLLACAEFLRRHQGHASLIGQLQAEIRQRARQRHPGFERLPVTEQWQLLTRLSRLEAALVRQAMRPLGDQHPDPTRFTRQVADLQRLRNAL
ncbi:DUF4350 domain-containing protein [Pseudomonas sp. GCM10022188]|uniref:DUF4350 domain-containing protein n=1 Tax=Pseudomonas TaxID=286 RepID=UPI001E2D5C30|nr:DUF4350 domain-containing protein [Pseudomonas oryzagri]MCC6074599.1 DUF4350 domain-containing protein [Pseudomonas oryzagri]